MTEPTHCPRCHKTDIVRRKRYAATARAPLHRLLLLGLYNLLAFLLRPAGPTCSWCWAYLTPRSLPKYDYDPFLAYRRHTSDEVVLRKHASAERPSSSDARWRPEQRHLILRYIAWRDDARCGLCALPLPVGQGNIEHIIPKRFGFFDCRGGRSVPGFTYESRLHHIDNLQAAHDYCNRAKGNNPRLAEWRHPKMWLLPAAQNSEKAQSYLWVPGARDV